MSKNVDNQNFTNYVNIQCKGPVKMGAVSLLKTGPKMENERVNSFEVNDATEVDLASFKVEHLHEGSAKEAIKASGNEVTFTFDDKRKIPIDRAYLKREPEFAEQYENGNAFEIHEMESTAFEAFARYCEKGRIACNEDVPLLLKFLKQFAYLEQLTETCSNLLIKVLKPENVWETFKLAVDYNLKSAIEATNKYIAKEKLWENEDGEANASYNALFSDDRYKPYLFRMRKLVSNPVKK